MEDRVKFYEHEHRYFYNSKELISVSAFVKRFEAPKDWGAIAKKYAKKNGGTADEWRQKWKEKGDKSSAIGTLFHNIREKELMAEVHPEFFGVRCDKLECEQIDGVKYGFPITNLQPNMVFPEIIIYDLDSMICGQSDKVITTPTHIHVMDYKTDKEIAFKAYSSDWVKPEKLLAPLQHLDNCSGNLYSLKMSLYLYMLCKQNKHLKPGKLIIEHVHLKRDEEGIPVLEDEKPVVLKIETIELPYRKMEVIDMLKTYKSQRIESYN